MLRGLRATISLAICRMAGALLAPHAGQFIRDDRSRKDLGFQVLLLFPTVGVDCINSMASRSEPRGYPLAGPVAEQRAGLVDTQRVGVDAPRNGASTARVPVPAPASGPTSVYRNGSGPAMLKACPGAASLFSASTTASAASRASQMCSVKGRAVGFKGNRDYVVPRPMPAVRLARKSL